MKKNHKITFIIVIAAIVVCAVAVVVYFRYVSRPPTVTVNYEQSNAAAITPASSSSSPRPIGPEPVIPIPIAGHSSSLSVGVASDNPSAGSIISPSSEAPVLALNFSAGSSSAVGITSLSFRMLGTVPNTSIAQAYLFESGHQLFAQTGPPINGVITFNSGINLAILAGQTKEMTLAVTMVKGVSPGSAVSFSLGSSRDIVAPGALISGNFPMNGHVFTVVTSRPSITVTSPSSGQGFVPGSTMTIRWTPTAGGVAEIDLVPADGSWPKHGEVIYALKVLGDPTNYSGSYVFAVPSLSSQIPAGSYYLNFYNPAPYSGNNQGPGTIIGQSAVFSIAAATSTQQGTLSLSQNSFNFTYLQGGSVPPAQSLTLSSNASVVFTINVNPQPDWLNESLASGQGTVSPGFPLVETASVNPSGLAPGTYTTNIVLTGNFANSPVTIPVVLTVTASTPVIQGALTVATDISTPPGVILVMGSAGNPVAAFRFAETSNNESVKITDAQVLDYTSPSVNKASFSNLQLFNGGTAVGTAGTVQPVSNGYLYSFHFTTPVIVPQGNFLILTLRGDIAPYATGEATDNSVHIFQLSSVTALGASSNVAITPMFQPSSGYQYPSGNPMAVFRTKVNASGASLGVTSNRMKSSVDYLGNLTLAADPAGSAAINRITVTFSGSALAGSMMSGVKLVDENYEDVVASGAAGTGTVSCSGSANASSSVNVQTCTETWNFGNGGWTIGAGSAYTFTLRVDDSLLAPGIANVSQGLNATIQSNADVTFSDGTMSSLSLQANTVPITIATVSFVAGM